MVWLQGLREHVQQCTPEGPAALWGSMQQSHARASADEELGLHSMDSATARQLSALRNLDFAFMPSLGCYMAVCGDEMPVLHLLGFADTLATTLEEK